MNEVTESMNEKPEEITPVHRFRFPTDHGDAYAVAVLLDDRWYAGFAFRHPKDTGKVKREMLSLGFTIALNRARGRRSTSWDALGVEDRIDGKTDHRGLEKELRQGVISWLLFAMKQPCPEIELGLREFQGKKVNGHFVKWFTGKFAEQFKERYAGGA